jgi:hypothetical protein
MVARSSALISGTGSRSRLPRSLAGAVAVIAALSAVSVCLTETPCAVGSFCGTCRGVAGARLEGEAVWAVATSLGAAILARFSGRGEFRVARSAAVVATVVWILAIGFVRRWW